jgi:hypothetical protein
MKISPGLLLSLYLAGATITYGHVVNENRIIAAKCEGEARNNIERDNCGLGEFFKDILESLLWPSHWSDVVWRHV